MKKTTSVLGALILVMAIGPSVQAESTSIPAPLCPNPSTHVEGVIRDVTLTKIDSINLPVITPDGVAISTMYDDIPVGKMFPSIAPVSIDVFRLDSDAIREELIHSSNRIHYSIGLPQFLAALKELEKDPQKYLGVQGQINAMALVDGDNGIYMASANRDANGWHASIDVSSIETCGGAGVVVLFPS
jgi:hypothetical protein